MARWGKLFRCVAQAVCGRGLKGLLGLIPFGEVVYDIAEDALHYWRQSETEEQMRASLQESVQAGSEEVKAEALQAVAEISAALLQPLPAAQKQTLTAYLIQMPALARQTLKRPDDLTGTTVPASLSLRQPEEMLPLLPARLPRFQPGEAQTGTARLDSGTGAGRGRLRRGLVGASSAAWPAPAPPSSSVSIWRPRPGCCPTRPR